MESVCFKAVNTCAAEVAALGGNIDFDGIIFCVNFCSVSCNVNPEFPKMDVFLSATKMCQACLMCQVSCICQC
jgi:hypothetical protein